MDGSRASSMADFPPSSPLLGAHSLSPSLPSGGSLLPPASTVYVGIGDANGRSGYAPPKPQA